jgi:hypothetical protein
VLPVADNAPLGFGDPARWRPEQPASKHTVVVAIRRVASARGKRQTIERLHQLAAEAKAWAAVLDVGSVGIRR